MVGGVRGGDGAEEMVTLPERLRKRVEWLAAPDPTWTEEDGRPPTRWAADQALALLERIAHRSVCGATEPVITATARGGIELVWDSGEGSELDVVLPGDAGSPIELCWVSRANDGTPMESERAVEAVEDVASFVACLPE